MIKASKLTLIASIFLCFGCQKLDIKQSKNQEESDIMEDFSNKAIALAMRNMQKKHNLIPAATGGAAPNKITYLSTWYTYNGKVDISKARIFFIDAVHELVNQVNALDELKPFLNEIPFIKERTDVKIFIQNYDGRDPKPGEIYLVDRNKHDIRYCVKDTNNKQVIIYKESVSEALANIEKQKKLQETETPSQM